MVQPANGAKYVNEFLNVTNSHVSIVEWKETRLTISCHVVLGVEMMTLTFNAYVSGAIHQRVELIGKIQIRAGFLIAHRHP
jgi:hypothetical protein